jgi:chromosome segregation ATPase
MSISENEMREFFQRIIDNVAELSTQASRVEGLTQQVNSLAERLSNLEQENYTLRSQIADANNTVARMDSEIVATRQSLDNERAVTASLRETIVARDAGVVSLENSFRQEQDAHKITTSERDDARQKISELNEQVAKLDENLNRTFADMESWRHKAVNLETENAKLQQQLDRINSVLNPFKVVSSDVA